MPAKSQAQGCTLPARSESQRRYLNAKFGHAWVKEHGFDNKGKLPGHVPKKKANKRASGMHGRGRGHH